MIEDDKKEDQELPDMSGEIEVIHTHDESVLLTDSKSELWVVCLATCQAFKVTSGNIKIIGPGGLPGSAGKITTTEH
jgi:hypothetical protein